MVYEFGARLLQLRKAKNLTQQALVDRAKALDPDLLFGAALLIALLAPANNAALHLSEEEDRRHPPAGAGAACLSGAGRVRAAVRQRYVGKLRRGVPACRRRAACVLQSGFGNAVMRSSYINAIEKEASR